MAEKTTPGFVDAHSHLRSTSLESQGVVPCANLEEALLRFTAMTGVDAFDDAFVASADLVKAGVTGVQVFFHTFAGKDDYLAILAEVIGGIKKSGIRALVILGITDQAEFITKELEDSGLLPPWLPPKQNLTAEQYADVFVEARKLFPDVSLGLGPIAGQWCSDKLLGQISELVDEKTRIHSHLLESPRQRNWVGENPLLRLDRFGLLGPKTSLAHGVWCEADDLDLIKNRGSQLVTCPGSNRALGAGKADLAMWQEHRVEFGFGLDSAAAEITPLRIASEAMGRDLAERILTDGGEACTDLNVKSDQVSWSDYEGGLTEEVVIAGKTLVSGGKLTYESEYESALSRIQQAMLSDSTDREERQRLLDDLMPAFQKALGE